MSEQKAKKVTLGTILSIAAVWLSTHAGGGFASGNEATQYYVQYGWAAVIMPFVTFSFLAFCYRQVIVMTNNHGYQNYKELFEELWQPYPKLEILFEIYFYVMLICATSAAIAGAASVFEEFGMPYLVATVLVALILLLLTIFGAQLIIKAASIMTIIIVICCILIFTAGISSSSANIATVLTNFESTSEYGFTDHNFGTILLKIFTYAGFQCGVVPALISCGAVLKTRRNASKAMIAGFILNVAALLGSCLMLMGWYAKYKSIGTALPALWICKAIGSPFLYYTFTVYLFFCFISTGVSLIFGLVPRFENAEVFYKIDKKIIRRIIISCLGMIIPLLFSLVGLTNVIKYGYGFAGILGFIVLLLPLFFIGTYKNWKFSKDHPNFEAKESEPSAAVAMESAK